MYLLLALYFLITSYYFHQITLKSVKNARYSYSNPSIILIGSQKGEQKLYIDDFREAYLWLKHNTDEDSHVMSWWDYGYQITGFSNRTVYIDNNTRDERRIAYIGSLLGSSEERAYKELIENKAFIW